MDVELKGEGKPTGDELRPSNGNSPSMKVCVDSSQGNTHESVLAKSLFLFTLCILFILQDEDAQKSTQLSDDTTAKAKLAQDAHQKARATNIFGHFIFSYLIIFY